MSATTERERIGVIGTGYVGLVTAAGFAALGSHVYCVDIDAEKVRGLQEGQVPIWEPGLEELIAEHRERLHFSTELAPALEHARLLFVAVGTPPTYSGDADLSAVHAVVDAMPASDRHALVMKSTVPVGTGESIERIFAEQRKGFAYVSCPEFLKEGSAVRDFLEPDRVVIGDRGDWAGDAVEALYAPLEAPIVRTDVKSAEMVKLASNAFLATKISFINEIANVCEETGADVVEVARGMGLDDRIGPKFLQAGIGFGGSCFAPGETVLARVRGQARLVRFEALWSQMDGGDAEAVSGDGLEVLSWVPGEAEPEWMAVSLLTRRHYDGEMVEVRTKTGRRVRTTVDHPFIVGDGEGEEILTLKAAGELDTTDWLPLALGGPSGWDPELAPVLGAIEGEDVLVRPEGREVAALQSVDHARERARLHDIRRSGTLRLSEASAAGMDLRGASIGTVGNGAWNPMALTTDEHFWRVVGRSIAELDTQRIPDLAWEQTIERKRALLAGLWEGDGSWSLINGGPSVILEWGTISDELAEGVARLLADVGLVCSWRRARTAKSTKETHWLRVSGADQIERGMFLVPERDRPGVQAALTRQTKRIKPTGFRRFEGGAPWVRVVDVRRERYHGPVYSLEVPGSHTVVATSGICTHQCFPKDVTALKQLAGNSGYHFQLLNAVIEVNELQKRRVIAKLQKHLGSLVGKEVALLGLAFKPNTDDMREASSLVLSARLQGSGARVRAYDPVAEAEARKLIRGVEFASTAQEAIAGADAIVLVTEWPEFKTLDLQAAAASMRGSLLVDGRNFIDPETARSAGLVYEAIGRPPRGGR